MWISKKKLEEIKRSERTEGYRECVMEYREEYRKATVDRMTKIEYEELVDKINKETF